MKYSDCTTKTAKTQFIRDKLETEVSWCIKGLKRIYEYQTAEEQAIGDTRMHNGVGFTGVDGELLSSFAEQVNRGRTLSTRQVSLLIRKMPKYAKQLMNIAENEAETV